MTIAVRREKCQTLVRKHYADAPLRGVVLDRAVIEAARPSHRLLDAGCGESFPLLRRYSHLVSFGAGIDLVTLSSEQNGQYAALQGDLERLPFREHSFELIISRSVMEHLERPVEVFRQLGRLLSVGGKLIFVTPNKYYYSCLIAGLLPFRVKDFYMERVFGADGYDHFPVYYRANTARAFEILAKEAGLRLLKVEAIRHYPYYLMFSPLLFRLGMVYDRLITALRIDRLQSNWLVVMEKCGSS